MKTYILVHGAWHGAWSYQSVKQILEDAGANVITFDLPGHGSSSKTDAPATLQSYVQKVREEIEKVNTPVVLVGHSLAGFIVTQVAEELPQKVGKLVFVAAMIPHDGKSIYDILSQDTGSQLLANLVLSHDKSWATVTEQALRKVVYNGATEEQIARAVPNLVRQSTQPFFVAVATSDKAFGRVPKAYIVCEKDRILSAGAQHHLIKTVGITEYYSIPTGHVPHVENPRALAAALLEV